MDSKSNSSCTLGNQSSLLQRVINAFQLQNDYLRWNLTAYLGGNNYSSRDSGFLRCTKWEWHEWTTAKTSDDRFRIPSLNQFCGFRSTLASTCIKDVPLLCRAYVKGTIFQGFWNRRSRRCSHDHVLFQLQFCPSN